MNTDRIDMTRPWAEIDEQCRAAYRRAKPVRPRRPGAAAVIPDAARRVHAQWTQAMLAHPDSPANSRD